MSEKTKDVLIRILLTIIIGLIVLIILITTNTISFGSKVEANQNENNITEPTKILTESEAITIGKELYDKMNEIKETSVLYPYCGVKLNEINNQTMKKYNVYGMGEANYYESKYNNLDELKNELKGLMSEEYVNEIVQYDPITDLTLLEKKESLPANYIIDGNKMYCRGFSAKGWVTYYIDNYDIGIDNIEENKITFNITSKYIKDEVIFENKSKCAQYPYDINNCTKDELEYKDTIFVIEKNSNDKWIVTNFKLHD